MIGEGGAASITTPQHILEPLEIVDDLQRHTLQRQSNRLDYSLKHALHSLM